MYHKLECRIIDLVNSMAYDNTMYGLRNNFYIDGGSVVLHCIPYSWKTILGKPISTNIFGCYVVISGMLGS